MTSLCAPCSSTPSVHWRWIVFIAVLQSGACMVQGQMGMEGLANVLGAYGQYNGAQFTPEQQASLLSSLGMQNVLGNNSLASQQMNPSQYGGLQPVDLSNSNNLVNNGAAGLGMGGINDGMYGQGNLYGGRGVASMGMQPARLNGQRDGEMGNGPTNGINSMYGHGYGAGGNAGLYPGQYPAAMPRQQRMGSGGANEVSNQWKLFVGQLPPEVCCCDCGIIVLLLLVWPKTSKGFSGFVEGCAILFACCVLASCFYLLLQLPCDLALSMFTLAV